jgi:hypothetical protein
VTVAHGVAAVVTLVLLVGLGCYVTGRIHGSSDARTYAVERRMARESASISMSEPEAPVRVGAERISPVQVPMVIHVHVYRAPIAAEPPVGQEHRVIEGEIVDIGRSGS